MQQDRMTMEQNKDSSRVERLVALQVDNDNLYNRYREEMYPILLKYHGDFGYDFKISEVLKSEEDKPINRVFTIHFSDEEGMKSFFEDEEYLVIKQRYFKASVSSVVEIARYNKK